MGFADPHPAGAYGQGLLRHISPPPSSLGNMPCCQSQSGNMSYISAIFSTFFNTLILHAVGRSTPNYKAHNEVIDHAEAQYSGPKRHVLL